MPHSARKPLSLPVLHIMMALAEGARHGYAIKQDVEARTHGALRLGPSTLYEAIQRLEDTGLIEAVEDGDKPVNGQEAQRRYYSLTPQGWRRSRTKCGSSTRWSAPRVRTRVCAKAWSDMVFVRLLLLLHPQAFRREYGQELCAGFAAMRQEPRYRGLRGWIVFHLDVLRDVVPAATRQRCSRFRSLRRGRPPMPDPHPKRNQMETVLQDIRQALRYFRVRPGFALVAILSFALAIGGNTAIFGIVDGFIFNPFPYPQPDRLVSVGVSFPKLSRETRYVEALSPTEYETSGQGGASRRLPRSISGTGTSRWLCSRPRVHRADARRSVPGDRG